MTKICIDDGSHLKRRKKMNILFKYSFFGRPPLPYPAKLLAVDASLNAGISVVSYNNYLKMEPEFVNLEFINEVKVSKDLFEEMLDESSFS